MVKKLFAFTLAEMMVVMLILTIILAAFAPLMTKRKVVDLSNPWRYSANNSDIYYGLAGSQTAMIGQNEKADYDPSSRLIINTNSSNQAHITFKTKTLYVADLLMKKNTPAVGMVTPPSDFRFGGPFVTANTKGGNTSFGLSTLNSLSTGNYNTAVGYETLGINTSGSGNVAVGASALYANISGNNNVAIGNSALVSSSGSNNVAIGANACSKVIGSNKTCIGANSGPETGSAYISDNSKLIYLGDKSTKVIIPGELLIMGNTYFHAIPANSPSKFEIGLMSWDGGDNDRMRLLNKMTCPAWYKECSPSLNWSSVAEYYSDKRLKNVNGSFTAGLDELKSLPLYNYTFKNDKNKEPQVGVLAQDLQKVFPNAVKKDESGYLMIRKDDMFYALINAVKQLDKVFQAVIGELKIIEIKLDTLIKKESSKDKQIKDLEKRIEKLEKQFS